MQDVARWLVALSTLAGFGLMLGLNPLLYGATADTLARNTRVVARVGWMVAGLYTGATALYFLLQIFDPTALVTVVEHNADTVARSRRVDVLAGAAFLVGALVVTAWKLRTPSRPARAPRANPAGAGSWRYFTLGLSCSIIGLTTLPIMYMTGRVAASVSADPLLRLGAYAVFLLALGAPFVLLAAAWSRFPRTAARVTRSYARLEGADFRWAYVAVLTLAGLACIVIGLLGLRVL